MHILSKVFHKFHTLYNTSDKWLKEFMRSLGKNNMLLKYMTLCVCIRTSMVANKFQQQLLLKQRHLFLFMNNIYNSWKTDKQQIFKFQSYSYNFSFYFLEIKMIKICSKNAKNRFYCYLENIEIHYIYIISNTLHLFFVCKRSSLVKKILSVDVKVSWVFNFSLFWKILFFWV